MAQQFDKIILKYYTLLLFLLFVGCIHLRSLIDQNHELSGQEHPVTDVFALYYAIKYSGVLRVGPLSDAVTQTIDSYN